MTDTNHVPVEIYTESKLIQSCLPSDGSPKLTCLAINPLRQFLFLTHVSGLMPVRFILSNHVVGVSEGPAGERKHTRGAVSLPWVNFLIDTIRNLRKQPPTRHVAIWTLVLYPSL